MRRSGERPKPKLRPRVRFATPSGIPDRWYLKRVGPGRYVIVDEQGDLVLEHWDPATRRANLHMAKGGRLARSAIFYAYTFIQQTSESPFKGWILQLLVDALRHMDPNARPTESLVAAGSVRGQVEAGGDAGPEGQEAA